ncbi:cytochrome P450 [Gigaspora margarita]|uniref:Cytochrome P450 n=1 Tax=Gigaspora margarita TaxID=4874 RepID=A0A8H3X8X3_GIGMA|nr:cytochrome P450 [Gigaspora margarita]
MYANLFIKNYLFIFLSSNRFSLRFISKHKHVLIKHIKLIPKNVLVKKKLGDAWVAPYFLNDPEIAPDLDPNNIKCNYIADLIGLIILAATSPTSNRASYVLYELAKKKEYWQELCQEAQEINKWCNGNFTTCDDIDKMVKLDRFIKEIFRLNNDVLRLPHRCLSDSHYTFTNAHQIPNSNLFKTIIFKL